MGKRRKRRNKPRPATLDALGEGAAGSATGDETRMRGSMGGGTEIGPTEQSGETMVGALGSSVDSGGAPATVVQWGSEWGGHTAHGGEGGAGGGHGDGGTGPPADEHARAEHYAAVFPSLADTTGRDVVDNDFVYVDPATSPALPKHTSTSTATTTATTPPPPPSTAARVRSPSRSPARARPAPPPPASGSAWWLASGDAYWDELARLVASPDVRAGVEGHTLRMQGLAEGGEPARSVGDACLRCGLLLEHHGHHMLAVAQLERALGAFKSARLSDGSVPVVECLQALKRTVHALYAEHKRHFAWSAPRRLYTAHMDTVRAPADAPSEEYGTGEGERSAAGAEVHTPYAQRTRSDMPHAARMSPKSRAMNAHFEMMIEVERQLQGTEMHPAVAAAHLLAARDYCDAGKRPEAEYYLEKAVAVCAGARVDAGSEEEVELGACLVDIARVELALGAYSSNQEGLHATAVIHLVQAHRYLRDARPLTAAVASTLLGRLFAEANKLRDAVQSYNDAVLTFQPLLEDVVRRASIEQASGQALVDGGTFEWMEFALECYENVGAWCVRERKVSAACEYFASALRLGMLLYGSEHPRTISLREAQARCMPRAAPPQWTRDDDVDACEYPRCGARFTLLVRRHHCRHCGRVVCGEHSRKRAAIPAFGPEYSDPVRVCDWCSAVLRHHAAQ